jgi:hypothetical protein
MIWIYGFRDVYLSCLQIFLELHSHGCQWYAWLVSRYYYDAVSMAQLFIIQQGEKQDRVDMHFVL